MQFTPQQMAGYKGYSPGVLIGNWSEDLQVMEDKMKLYDMTKAGISTNANSAYALKAVMTEAADIGPALPGNVLAFGVPLMLRSVATDSHLALDLTPRYAPRLNHVCVTFAPSKETQVRSVWVLHRVVDENADFYAAVKEEAVVHYGQRLKLVNEDAGNNGFYSLVSSLQDRARSSGRQELAACLGGGNGTVFVVEPAGAPKGSKDGRPVLASDTIVLVHNGSNAPVACETNHRCSNAFGAEYEASCGITKSQATRAQSTMATQPGNFFQFVVRAPGAPYKAAPPKSVPQAMDRVRAKILERGGRLGFRGLARTLSAMDDSGDRCLSRAEFRDAMESYGVPLNSSDLDAVFKTFDRNGDGKVTATEFIRTMRGEMSSKRLALVQQAFDRLNKDGCGDIELHELLDVYSSNASKHPDAESGGATHTQLVKEFMSAWGGCNGRITRAQFVDYYSDISAAIDHDDYFELMLRNAWHISGGQGWAENTTARRILVVFNDDTQRVVELTDDLGLSGSDKDGIMKKLAAQGVTNIKRIELSG